MKKIILLLLLLFCIGAVCACKKKDVDTEQTKNTNDITKEVLPDEGDKRAIVETQYLTKSLMSEDSKTMLLFGTYLYPQIKNDSDIVSIQKVNESIKQRANTEFKASFQEGSTYVKDVFATASQEVLHSRAFPYVTEQQYQMTYGDHFLFSYIVEEYTDFDSANPSIIQKSYTYDLLTGEELPLTFFLTDRKEEADALAAKEFAKLVQEDAATFYPDALQTLESKQFSYQYYLEPDGIVLYMNAYELAPGATGVIQTKILFDSQNENLRSLDRLGIEMN